MNRLDLDKMLKESFEDHHLSRAERKALRGVLEERAQEPEERALLRRAAFAIAREAHDEGRGRQALEWLEDVMALVFNVGRDSAFAGPSTPPSYEGSEACFSPGDACVSRIVSLFSVATGSVDACVFTVTDDRITRAVEEAHRRGIRVRLVSDDEKAMDAGSDIPRLRRLGVAVAIDRDPAHMHHKFAIFDRRLLLNGSYNWTRSAAERNCENIVVTPDPTLLRAFQAEFDKLWTSLAR